MKTKLNKVNWASHFLMFRNWLINNLIILIILPLTVTSIIFINYGDVIDKVLQNNPELFKLYQLKTQLKILSFDIEMPSHIKSLGYDSVIFLILLFFTWLLTHSFFCYTQLSQQLGSKARLFFETILLLLIFIYFVSPDLPLAVIVLGYSAVAAQIILIALYWAYSLKQKL